MTLTPTEIHGRLDTEGLLDDAHGPGCYALRVDTPDSVEGIARAFLSVSEVTPSDAAMDRLTSGKCAYVGASNDVYDRLMDHAEGDVRRATFLRAFEVVDVVDVWPSDTPFRDEFNCASSLSRESWAVWYDGQVL